MDDAIETRKARKPWRLRPSVDLVDHLEHAPALDRPILRIAGIVRERLPTGRLRDTLHGVFAGHPIHPPLAMISLGCWFSTAVLDLTDADPRAARALITTGIANALPTAAAGITDWSVLHREQQRVGFVHAAANLTALGLYSGSLYLRLTGRERGGRTLAFLGLAVAGLGGYLGGHMAFRQAAGANHAESVAHLVPLGWHDLCQLADLPNGRPVVRRLGYIALFVLRRDDEVWVLADQCSHLAGPLHQGRIAVEAGDQCIICPWHGSTFRITDGAVVHGPATARQPAFQTRILDDGLVQVRPEPSDVD
ncbi:Rieske 2Fe-2S domain-containing protein [Rhizohabitans arisaemae]|uniref:Rieske 2Fe-2S domain-containing protein n=1 Tax=Rhizohabitans arisaemae TaxID=2720610 RepID=UPI0024B22D8C|nr:Rieske 2Fe-2S domain-containing protein [Rhizohabitans arisaemae]